MNLVVQIKLNQIQFYEFHSVITEYYTNDEVYYTWEHAIGIYSTYYIQHIILFGRFQLLTHLSKFSTKYLRNFLHITQLHYSLKQYKTLEQLLPYSLSAYPTRMRISREFSIFLNIYGLLILYAFIAVFQVCVYIFLFKTTVNSILLTYGTTNQLSNRWHNNYFPLLAFSDVYHIRVVQYAVDDSLVLRYFITLFAHKKVMLYNNGDLVALDILFVNI